jgi:hypothetical protein
MAQQTFEELVAAVKQAESRGKRYAADGKTLTTSPKGALGEMQVMPGTIKDPGFGVIPAKSSSPDEIARVGVDYLQAMKQKYGDTEKALIAYNWGPGSTDKWIAAGAKPEALPQETRTYVQRVKGFLGKDVSRETVAKKEREPLPASLPPMAEAAPPTPAKATTVAKLDMANMPASYKAAFALAALADAQDEEDDRVYNENKGTETEAFFANYKPVNHLASLDLSVAPVNFADGGEVTERKDEPFFDAASRTFVDVMTGRRTPITEKDFTAKEQLAMMDAVKRSQARGGKGRVDYQDYPDASTVGPGYVDIRNTLGGFQYKQNPDGSTSISDRYDFHGPRVAEYEKMGSGEKLVKSAKNALTEFVSKGFSPRDAAGELGRAWIGSKGPDVNIRIPVNRAEGGDAEPTAEEIAAASTPAFIAQKSGIGRREGNISKALKSGEALTETAKGLTMLPQNIVGAPVDLATMAMRPFGYNVEKPVMGSDYLKEKSRSAGLAFKPSDDPTLAGFYGAGDLASNLVNPAGVTRAGVKAAEKTGEAAKMLARDFQGYNQQLAIPGASYAIRNRGTPFLGTPQQVNYQGKVTREAMSEADDYADWLARNFGSEPSLKTWLKDKVGAYLRRDFGTESDQMVQAADQGKKLHFMSPKLTENVPHLLGRDIGLSRELEGFPKSGFAKTPQGQKVEEVIDSTIHPLQLQDVSATYQVPPSMRQFVDTNPEMRVSQMGPIDENLKFDELAQAMGKMFKEKEFKAYGETVPMPKEYILTEDTLKGLTPAQASNRVANKMEWVEKKRAELAGVAISKDPRIVSQSYDNGSKWISPADLAENPNHAEMVKDIGCAGGWCTDKANFALDYGSGENRLNILLDKKFEPRVQLTLNQPQPSVAEFAKYIYLTNNDSSVLDEMAKSAYGWYTAADAQIEAKVRAMPEYQQYVKQYQPEKSITEIKGQFNNSDLTKSPYLKQVQDFVKRQGTDLQRVDNLGGINMVDMRNTVDFSDYGVSRKNLSKEEFGAYTDLFNKKLVELNGNSYFVDKDRLPDLVKTVRETIPTNKARQIQMNLFGLPKEKATGGMIERQPNDNRRYL